MRNLDLAAVGGRDDDPGHGQPAHAASTAGPREIQANAPVPKASTTIANPVGFHMPRV